MRGDGHKELHRQLTSMMPQAKDPHVNGNASLDRQRFTALWRKVSEDSRSGSSDMVFDELVSLYTGPDRHYHCAEHIRFCLDKLDEAREAGNYSINVEMAVWFHDAIYEAGDSENERKSASWFAQCTRGHLSREMIDEISQLIVATTHRDTPNSWQEKLLVDVDLSSFGLPWEKFLEDGHNIRLEFGHLSDEEFVSNQSRFLNGLLERPVIFHTRHFSDCYEAVARQNIRGLLKAFSEGKRP